MNKQILATCKMLSGYYAFIFLVLLTTSCNVNSKKNNNEKEEALRDSIHFKSGYARLSDLNMYYEIYGEGKPIVLIHGGGSTIQTSFGRIIPYFSKHRQIIAVELQGHGHTADVDRPESFEQDADDVAALLKYFNIDRADFFGFSNGGNTTMQIAIRHPNLVRKIILASAFFKRTGMIAPFWGSMKNASIDNMPEQLKVEYKKVAPDTSGLIKMFTKDRNRMLDFVDWNAEDIHSIQAPTLIISADEDVVRPEHAVEMYRLIPNSQLAIFPGGHGKYMGEITTLSGGTRDYLLIVPLIEEFLDKEEKGQTGKAD
ncbi:MAG: alpha/beta fold hydrolase [Chitinophagales bacterium]